MDADQHPDLYSFEPLSQRERDILALLAQNLSDREIADRLVLAYTTVKWYNRQIFSKLSVESRQQAVERATSLGLLVPARPSGVPSIRNFPALLTPFVGRVGELEDLNHLLTHPNTRFVTILAPGGMGKTRLALTAAEATARHFADGVTFVPLAAIASVEVLMTTIADALGLQLFPDSRTLKQRIIDYLRDKHILLVLDNFEHLLEGGSLISDSLASAAHLKVLVTSRERLNLEGETVYTLGGLSYPERTDDENLLDCGAARLFIECARRANSHFVAQDEPSIVRVCQLVQGMPLALEMAAAWIGMLSPEEIAEEITRSADFLRTTMRNFPDRLRSVRAVFEATWKRMTDDERKGFRRLSIFRGGCTREAAQVVAGTDLNVLAGLVDKALLWHRPESGRYEVHELLRQYAAQQLEVAGETEATRAAHRDYFGKVAHQWGKALKTPRQLLALDVLDADLDNLREAFRRAIETGTPEVLEPFADLWYFYEIRTRYVEGEKLFGAAVDILDGQDSIALARHLLGHALMYERLYRIR